MEKIQRHQMIVMLLKQNGRMSAKNLSDYLEVSLRTIYRDIDALSQMNIPIIAFEGLNGGYEVDPSYFLPTIRLSDKEIFILMLLLKISKKLNLPDFIENINILDTKLRNICSGTATQYYQVLDKITFDLQYIYTENFLRGTFESILNALNHNLKLRIQYFVPLKNELNERIISPLHLFYSEGCWYLDGFCHLRMQKRTFRLDRIHSIHELTEKVDMDIHKKYKDKTLDDPKFLLEFYIDRDLYTLIKDDGAMREAAICGTVDKNYHIKIVTNRTVYFETLAIRNITQVTIKKPDFFIESLKEKFLQGIEKYN